VTKEQLTWVLNLLAQELEAAAEGGREDLRDVARAYRRAADLVATVEVRRRPGRPRATVQPVVVRATARTGRRGRAVAAH
jgi:hypothetical protein